MLNGRKWVQDNTQNHNVFNLFAYTCGFSIAALSGGAEQVVNIDICSWPHEKWKAKPWTQ
jgi:23S rRNA (cytosine1962-C5)-methyltransferase